MKKGRLFFFLVCSTVVFLFASFLFAKNSISAQSNSLYQPCSNPESGVDVLIMMDQSGSLRNVDPDGEKRRKALRLIREKFSQSSAKNFRLAILGFKGFKDGMEAGSYLDFTSQLLPDFKTASTSHPTDSVIEEAVKGNGDTDYKLALEASLELFEQKSNKNSCRLLLFFTDGIIDPKEGPKMQLGVALNGLPITEEDYANDLLDDVCGVKDLSDLKKRYMEANIQTYAVLLGGAFESALTAGEHKKQMATVSLQIIRALTGHENSDLEKKVSGIPRPTTCRTWDDSQSGEIVFAENVDDLVNSLLLPLSRADSFVDMTCDLKGTTATSEKLAAGIYIEAIHVFANGGEIIEHPFTSEEIEKTEILLKGNELKSKESGWKLELKVRPRDNQTVKLTCLSKRNEDKITLSGNFYTTDGRVETSLLDTTKYSLKVDTDLYVGSFEKFELESPDINLKHDDSASCDFMTSNSVSFDVSPKNSEWEISKIIGKAIPCYAKATFGDLPEMYTWDVLVEIPETRMSSADKKSPQVKCDWDRTITKTSGVFPVDTIDIKQCSIIPRDTDETSTTSIQLDWEPDTPAARGGLWLSEDSKLEDDCNLKLDNKEICVLEVQSEPIGQMIKDGDLGRTEIIEGVWKLKVNWTPADGSDKPTKVREQKVKINPADNSPSIPEGLFYCDEGKTIRTTNVIKGNEVPREPLKGTTNCVLRAPEIGSVQVSIVEHGFNHSEADSDSPIHPEWDFQPVNNTGKMSKSKSELFIVAGEDDLKVNFVTESELENARWSGNGSLLIQSNWIWTDSRGGTIADNTEQVELVYELDLRGRSNSATAFILTLLITLLAILLSYYLLYWILARNTALPSVQNFWLYEKRFKMSYDEKGQIEIDELSTFNPSIDELSQPTGDNKKGKWIKAGPFRLKATHAPFWNLPSLIRGGWGEIILEEDPSEAVVVFLLPRAGVASGINAIDGTLRTELETLIKERLIDSSGEELPRKEKSGRHIIGGYPTGRAEDSTKLIFEKAFLFAIPRKPIDSKSDGDCHYPSSPGEPEGLPSSPGEPGGLPSLPGEPGGLPSLPGDSNRLPRLPD